MNFQRHLKLFVSSVFSPSGRSQCGWSIQLCQGRELAFGYLHCQGCLFSSGRTWLPDSHRELGMTFFQKASDLLPRKWETQVPDTLKGQRFGTYRFPCLSEKIHKPLGHSGVSEHAEHGSATSWLHRGKRGICYHSLNWACFLLLTVHSKMTWPSQASVVVANFHLSI